MRPVHLIDPLEASEAGNYKTLAGGKLLLTCLASFVRLFAERLPDGISNAVVVVIVVHFETRPGGIKPDERSVLLEAEMRAQGGRVSRGETSNDCCMHL